MIIRQFFTPYFYHFRNIFLKRSHDASSGYDRILEKPLMLQYWCSRSNVLIYILSILAHIVISNKYTNEIDIYEGNILEQLRRHHIPPSSMLMKCFKINVTKSAIISLLCFGFWLPLWYLQILVISDTVGLIYKFSWRVSLGK